MVVATLDSSTSTTIVNKSINSLLKHSFFISNDNVRSLKLDQVLQAVIAVNHSSIKIIQVARRKPATIKLNHWM